jgi:hypothetical protein
MSSRLPWSVVAHGRKLGWYLHKLAKVLASSIFVAGLARILWGAHIANRTTLNESAAVALFAAAALVLLEGVPRMLRVAPPPTPQPRRMSAALNTAHKLQAIALTVATLAFGSSLALTFWQIHSLKVESKAFSVANNQLLELAGMVLLPSALALCVLDMMRGPRPRIR